MPPLLKTEDLKKSFGALVANDGISLSVEEGEVARERTTEAFTHYTLESNAFERLVRDAVETED
jgi:ABC-type histidine transport system ATPase subunit